MEETLNLTKGTIGGEALKFIFEDIYISEFSRVVLNYLIFTSRLLIEGSGNLETRSEDSAATYGHWRLSTYS